MQPLRGPRAARWFLRFFVDPIGALGRAHHELGPISAVGNVVPLPRPEQVHVLALGPDCNRQVLGDPALFRTTGQGLGGPRGSAQRRLRYGLTRSQRKHHDAQREFILPPFQKKAVDATCDKMVAITDKLLGDWSAGDVVDVWREARKLTLRISSDILFARDDPERSHRLGEMIGEWLSLSFSAGVWALMADLPGSPYGKMLRQAEAIECEVRAMVEEKRVAGANGDDVVSMLVRAHEAGYEWMTDTDLVGQTTILFAASYETTANALTWTLYLLAQHPQVAAALVDEIEARLGGAPPTIEALAAMPLLERVLRESMRILPPVPYTIRVLTRRTQIGDFALRKGDRVICSHYVTHHLPDLYAEPERFDPDRWLSIRRNQYEYLPFSAGPRQCIGGSFATQALKIAVAMMLQRYRLSVVPESRIDRAVHVTMSPSRGLPMEIHPPDGRFHTAPVRGQIRDMVDLPVG